MEEAIALADMEDMLNRITQMKNRAEYSEKKARVKIKQIDLYQRLSDLTAEKLKVLSELDSGLKLSLGNHSVEEKLAKFKIDFLNAKKVLDFDDHEFDFEKIVDEQIRVENVSDLTDFRRFLSDIKFLDKMCFNLTDSNKFETKLAGLGKKLKGLELQMNNMAIFDNSLLRQSRLDVLLAGFYRIRNIIDKDYKPIQTFGIDMEIYRGLHEFSYIGKILEMEIDRKLKLKVIKADELVSLKAKFDLLGEYRGMSKKMFLLLRKFYIDEEDMNENTVKKIKMKYRVRRKQQSNILEKNKSMQSIEKELIKRLIQNAGRTPTDSFEFWEFTNCLETLQKDMTNIGVRVENVGDDESKKLNHLLIRVHEFKVDVYGALEGNGNEVVYQYPWGFKLENMILKLGSANAQHFKIQYQLDNDGLLTPAEKNRYEKERNLWEKSIHNLLQGMYKVFSAYLGNTVEYERENLHELFEEYCEELKA